MNKYNKTETESQIQKKKKKQVVEAEVGRDDE